MADLTPKQEKFCLAIANGMNQTDAYRKCYNVRNMKPTTVHVEACKLSKDPNIAERIAEHRKGLEKASTISREWVVQKLIENAQGALEDGQLSVANRAYELLGKELGMFVCRNLVCKLISCHCSCSHQFRFGEHQPCQDCCKP